MRIVVIVVLAFVLIAGLYAAKVAIDRWTGVVAAHVERTTQH